VKNAAVDKMSSTMYIHVFWQMFYNIIFHCDFFSGRRLSIDLQQRLLCDCWIIC